MSLNADDIRAIANLAKLNVSDDELPAFEQNLSNILGLVETMDAVDTRDIEPMAHPLHMTQRLREDAVTEQNQRDALQEHAPSVEKGLFSVPKVIE